MFSLLQKYVRIVSVILLMILLIVLVFYNSSSQLFSIILLFLGLGTAIIFTLNRNWETKQNDELTNAQFARNTAIDLLGLALIMLSAMWLGRMAGGYAGETLGMIAGIIVGIVVGFAAALVAGKVWARVSDRLRATA